MGQPDALRQRCSRGDAPAFSTWVARSVRSWCARRTATATTSSGRAEGAEGELAGAHTNDARVIARVLVVTGVVILAFAASDPLTYPGTAWSLLAVRLVWGGTYLALAAVLRRGSGALAACARTGVAVATPFFFGAFLAYCGPVPNGAFPWLLALPFALVLLLRSKPVQAAAASVLSLVVGVALLAWGMSDATTIAQWAFSLMTAGLLATWSAHYQERLRRAADAAARARAAAHAELQASERRSAELERLALVGQLAAGVAHEVNNPLAVVRANLGFLREHAASLPAAELGEVLGESAAGVDRIATIVQALRVYAADAAGTEQPVALAPAIAQAIAMVDAVMGSRLASTVDVDADLPRVRAEEPQLVKALAAILDNAADAVRGSRRERPRIRVGACRDGAHVLLTVDDDGPGFSAAALARAGTPFFTTKGPGRGTGLGLATARAHLQRMGAELTVANRPEGGARVRMRLRCDDDEATGPAAGARTVASARAVRTWEGSSSATFEGSEASEPSSVLGR